ncbi:MAG: UDP-2,3-diacylglucosamine diphosphatase [Gammaproteobacteria bacterium]|nr:UDP-2,3-diacylglucosamine diphosphatase [Gammaproteobacteria bacterium]MDE2250738.1 UDP-2,3-diacylglucosamine diphosphatase [Gammaproteobacteria bacterium]
MAPTHRPEFQVRSAFLSDIHLGARECRAELLLGFLHRVHMQELYLVGDVIDVWSLRRSFYWPQRHNEVLRTILGKARHGTRVIYVPGNHDEEFRDLDAAVFGNLEVHREYVHTTAAGMRMLVAHGDEFDASVKFSRWLAALGSGMYDASLALNRIVNRVRRAAGFPYWSLASYLKSKLGSAGQYVRLFEDAAAQCAQRRGLDGIICGHIHRPANRELHGVRYCNTGDWVENCSALIEDRGGELRLWQVSDWAQEALAGRRLAAAA